MDRQGIRRWAALGLVLGVVSAGTAQAESEAGSDAPPDKGTVNLDDITVSTTRVEKPLLKVPASISVVEQDAIQLARPQLGLDESLNRVPGVFMQNRYNFAQDLRIAIRGSGARAAFGIRGIKIIADGIPETLPDGQGQVDSIDLGSAQRVEVIRGPSSSLYGNASGGVINVFTEEGPPTPFVEGRLAGGEYGYRKYQLKAGGQHKDLNYLVNASKTELDGYRDHSRVDHRQLNSKFRYAINERSDFTTVFNVTDSPLAQDPGGLTAQEVAQDRTQARARNVAFDSGETLDQQRLGFVYHNDFSANHRLTLRNYYVWRDFQNKLVTGRAVDLERFFVGGGAKYTWTDVLAGHNNRLIAGIDLDAQDDDRRNFVNALGNIGPLILDQNEQFDTVGVYAQNEFAINDRFELTAGARYDYVSTEVKDRFLADGDDSGKDTQDELSPMLGLLYRASPHANVYGNISTAFEVPTTTELANPAGGGFNPNLKPQTTTSYEVGVKGSVGPLLLYEAVAYHMDVDDTITPFEDPNGDTFFRNAGRSDRNGLELGTTARVAQGLTATASYTYSDFTFDRFTDENGNVFDGRNEPGIPEHLLFAELFYAHPSGFYAGWDWMYVGDFFADNANRVKIKSHDVSNLRMGYTTMVGQVEVGPYFGINNLFDEKYNQNIRLNAFGGRYFEPAPDRNVYAGITVRYDFGG